MRIIIIYNNRKVGDNMSEKFNIKKGSIEETFLLPLWGRAYETKKKQPRLVDTKAVEIINQIDYDFSNIEKTQSVSQHGWIARSLHIDQMIKEFIDKYPNATIVNIGCGMDTTFTRIDNGKILFYELDLPDVIALRKNFYEETDRHKSIASSFLETEYFKEITVNDSILFIAGGVFMYFSEQQIKNFFQKAADYFKNCDFYFDTLSPKVIQMAKKKVLDDGGMEMEIKEGWGIKPISVLETWDPRFHVESKVPMYKNVRSNIKLSHRIQVTMADLIGASYMVHLSAKS